MLSAGTSTGGGRGSDREDPEKKAARESMLRTALTTEARQRLANVKMVRPQLASAIEEYVIQLAPAGRRKKAIDDEQLNQRGYALQEKQRAIQVRRMKRVDGPS